MLLLLELEHLLQLLILFPEAGGGEKDLKQRGEGERGGRRCKVRGGEEV